MAKKLLSNVPFAALLTYSPYGSSETSQKSRRACYGIKNGRESLLEGVVSRCSDQCLTDAEFAAFFGEEVVLVPAPRSAPLVDGALWPAERLCETLVWFELGKSVERVLTRTEQVPKSSFARPGERPGVERHLETMTAEPSLLSGAKRMTVVDDVITKGRTLYAGCRLVKETFPDAEVRAFAMVRTMGLQPEVEKVLDPCVGKLTYNGWDVEREP